MIRENNENAIAIPFLILVGILILAVGVLAVMYFQHSDAKTVAAVDSGTCTCADIPDLKNRLNEVNAAIAEYKLAIADVQAHDKEVGSPTMYNEGTFNDEQANVQIAINGAHTKGARTGTGDTDTACETKVDAPSSCLKGSIQTHENVHSATCLQTKKNLDAAGKGSWTTNYKNSMTMIEYWNDEIAAYSAEIPYLNREIASAKSDAGCFQYECKKGSGVFYDDAVECTSNCIRKIATLDNWCWEYSPGSSSYTGIKY
jgi:hypothetical protein